MNAPGTAPPHQGSTQSGPFGSALSVSEFAALNAAGVFPVAAVMGCDLESDYVDLPLLTPQPATKASPSPYGSSNTYGGRYEPVGVSELDQMVNESRNRALTRLRDEAATVGANVVLGIRQIQTTAAEGIWSQVAGHRRDGQHRRLRYRPIIDYQLVGTAVRDPALTVSEPCLTTFSATDFCKLRDAGWRPAGIVAGCSHWFGVTALPGVSAREITSATALWANARAHAFEQARTEMTALGAQAMIGLDVEDESAAYERNASSFSQALWTHAVLVTVSAIANAIERAPTLKAVQPPMRILTLQ